MSPTSYQTAPRRNITRGQDLNLLHPDPPRDPKAPEVAVLRAAPPSLAEEGPTQVCLLTDGGVGGTRTPIT